MLTQHDLQPDQLDAIDREYNHDATLLIGGMGVGKTVITATAAWELIQHGVLGRVLITAPLLPCDTAWRKVWTEWAQLTGASVAFALGHEPKRLEAVNSQSDFVVINHENLIWLKGIKTNFDGLVIDELTKFKNAGSPQFRGIHKIARKAKWVVGLTGTPCDEEWMGFYDMVKLIDKGAAFGTRKDEFKNEYFYHDMWNTHKWHTHPGAEAKIVEKLRNVAYVMPDYTHTLPALAIEPIKVPLSPEARESYQTMKKDFVLDGIEAVNAAVQSGKLKQLASGFIYDDEQNTTRSGWHKTDMALALLAASHEPLLVVYSYVAEIELLCEKYPNAPVLGNGTSRKKKQAAIEAFARGEHDVMFLHPASAGHGTDGLQDTCHEMLFLSPVWSLDAYKQVIARIWRRGQKLPVKVSVLLGEDTIDETDVMPGLDVKAENMPLFLKLWGESGI